MRLPLVLLAALLLASRPAAQHAAAPAELLERVGRYVETYFATAGTILTRETIRIQAVDGNLAPREDARILVYELRIESAPGNLLPRMTRERMRAAGHVTPIPSETECFDPPDASIEPLAMLLPGRQKEFTFALRGDSGGRIVELEYLPALRKAPTVAWDGKCGRIDVNGSTRGRIRIEAATGTVLRVTERLDKPFSFVSPWNVFSSRGAISQTLDRFESSIEYEAVRFRDPEETLVLPKSARTVTVIHNGGVPRLVTLQSFDNYRRFMTGGRVVK